MGKWVYRILVGVSLLMAMGTLWFWSYSYGVVGDMFWMRDGRGYGLGFKEGELYFQTLKTPTAVPDLKVVRWTEPVKKSGNASRLDGYMYQMQYYGEGWKERPVFLGIVHETYLKVNPASYHRINVPMYWPLVLASLLPVWALWMKLRHGRIIWLRKDQGMCLQCGYDLRATPTRCPECGTERGVMDKSRPVMIPRVGLPSKWFLKIIGWLVGYIFLCWGAYWTYQFWHFHSERKHESLKYEKYVNEFGGERVVLAEGRKWEELYLPERWKYGEFPERNNGIAFRPGALDRFPGQKELTYAGVVYSAKKTLADGVELVMVIYAETVRDEDKRRGSKRSDNMPKEMISKEARGLYIWGELYERSPDRTQYYEVHDSRISIDKTKKIYSLENTKRIVEVYSGKAKGDPMVIQFRVRIGETEHLIDAGFVNGGPFSILENGK